LICRNIRVFTCQRVLLGPYYWHRKTTLGADPISESTKHL